LNVFGSALIPLYTSSMETIFDLPGSMNRVAVAR
jgi:hypothetical protein